MASVLDTMPSFQPSSVRAFPTVQGLYHVKMAEGAPLDAALAALGRNTGVLYAEPNFVVEVFAEPNDELFGDQWGLKNIGMNGGTPGADIGAVEAWNITTGSDDVVVAVIDTGIDYRHRDLALNVHRNIADCDEDGGDDDGNGYADDCYGIDTANGDSDPMDDNDHGTHVAGIIGAVGNDRIGVTGVNWNVRLLACKAFGAKGKGSTAAAIGCLDYVATLRERGVNVVATNNSWGSLVFSQALSDAIGEQSRRGILFVAAAGNYGLDNNRLLTSPCSYWLPNIVCVAATTNSDRLAWWSNVGSTTVHLAAPGEGILSTVRGNAYRMLSGTSTAAPHVAGTAALLFAQDRRRDWRVVRNLLLAGGDEHWSLVNTITGRRLDAYGALSCSSSMLTARLRPMLTRLLIPTAAEAELAVLNINCGAPAGEVSVTVAPTGEIVTLRDDGLGLDQVSGDGVYTAAWTPPAAGVFDMAFPGGSVVRVEADPHLRMGFPVKTFHDSGAYIAGPNISALTGDIDGDEQLEILASGLAQGPLYAWEADGRSVSGWPRYDIRGPAVPTLGELARDSHTLEVFAAHYGAPEDLVARGGSGRILTGWPGRSANYVGSAAALADVDGDGQDEIFLGEEDWSVHAYTGNGTPLPGWPVLDPVGNRYRHTPAIGDLDGDSDLEIVTATGWVTGSLPPFFLLAYHHDGTAVEGFPVQFEGYSNLSSFPVIGDVDGDGEQEIVVGGRVATNAAVFIFSGNGTLERTLISSGVPWAGHPLALADLDSDGMPEIVLQTGTAVEVWKGDGAMFPGWPVTIGTHDWLVNIAPVVGDLDGDQSPDIAVLVPRVADVDQSGDVMVFHSDGTLHPGFPKRLREIGAGAAPAIADLDLDGRNELLVGSSYWDEPGYYDKIWVYDLGGPGPHGDAEWAQFGGGPRHSGYYEPTPAGVSHRLVVSRTGSGGGSVASDLPGIACGSDCSHRYRAGALVMLTATPASRSRFDGWGGDCEGQGNPCVLPLDAARRVTASFLRLSMPEPTRRAPPDEPRR